MLNDMELKMFALCVVTYTTFFGYAATKNPILEYFLTILLMLTVAVLTHLSATKEEPVEELQYEIYDDKNINGSDEEDEEDEEEEDHEEQENQDVLTELVDTLPRTEEEIDFARAKALEQLREVERASNHTRLAVSVLDRVRAIDLSGTVQDLSGVFTDAPLVPRVGTTGSTVDN